MKKLFWNQIIRNLLKTTFLFLIILWFFSCEDEYIYDNSEPEWLGSSIYDYLNLNENFNYFTRLIDDVGYKEVLAKTGSKTLFVANDSAFERFFQENEWKVKAYDQLSLAQKKLILNFAMINNAYLIETLANFNNGDLQLGTAIRRSTAVSVLDSIPFESGDMLPKGTFWDKYKEKGIYLLKDATPWSLVHFLQSNLDNAGITNSDYKLITGIERENNDAHIFDKKVIVKDITCKNGYVHVLEDVLIPPVNIAVHIHDNNNSKIFSTLLERFSAPYYNAEQTIAYNQNNPDSPIDSIFEMRFFSLYDGAIQYPTGRAISKTLMLPFNPGRNDYMVEGGSLQSDMAAILCPSDAAMEEYFETGSGIVLKDRYGSWDNIPDDIVLLFIKRHLRESFLATVPERFDKMNDSENSPLFVDRSDITDSYIGLNGVVYHTNEVYPPDDYVSVYGPVLFSDKTKVLNWVIQEKDYRLYLNSLVSTYSFFVPTDEFFDSYIDPIAYTKDKPAVLKYYLNSKTSDVNATVYSYDKENNIVGDSIGSITNSAFLVNRLLDVLDAHIVIGDVESGSGYYLTKNGNTLKIEGSGENLKVQGGNDIKRDITVNVISGGVFEQQNGKTYFIDKPIQPPLKSVYKTLSETPEFSEFFNLLEGFTGTNHEIFVKKTNYFGMDFNIKFFNTFNYTIYVPTNEAIQQAIADSIIPAWSQINAIADSTERSIEIKKLERFLRYHFQDNAVFVGGDPVDKTYQTATIKLNDEETQFRTYKDKYYKIGVKNDGDNIELSTENYGTANVIKDNNLYNIMVRDYIFNDNPQAFMEADGTGIGNEFYTSRITTSSTAVIHQIDNILRFE